MSNHNIRDTLLGLAVGIGGFYAMRLGWHMLTTEGR